MKHIVTLLIIILLPVLAHGQGTMTGNTEKVKKSLEIAREMLKAIEAMPDGFKSYKGEFSKKDAEYSYYKAKDIDLSTDQQYVVENKSGALSFFATYKKKDKDDKTPILAFVAFTTGIGKVTDGKDYVVENAPYDSTSLDQTYYMNFKNARVATFTFNSVLKSGTFLVGH